MYIATDQGGRDRWTAIYGVGDTAGQAVTDARCGAGEDAEFDVLPATAELAAAVRERGGAPRDVNWTVIDGVAELEPRGYQVRVTCDSLGDAIQGGSLGIGIYSTLAAALAGARMAVIHGKRGPGAIYVIDLATEERHYLPDGCYGGA